MAQCDVCKADVEKTDDNSCMDCGIVFCSKHINELSDGSCGCTAKHCVHDAMHDGLRCPKCSQEREVDIMSSIADWEM
jgi:hypothetical protein